MCKGTILLNNSVTYVGVKIANFMTIDETDDIIIENVLDDYSVIYINDGEAISGRLFRCVTGLGPTDSSSNDEIGDLYFNNSLSNTCNGFVEARGANSDKNPGVLGVLNVRLCGGEELTTSTQGVYTCRLMNSSMMYQSVSVGVYFSGRSESFYYFKLCLYILYILQLLH